MSTPVIIISPVGALSGPGWEYYAVSEEFPNEPLHTLLRFILYPWAYAVNNIAPVVLPPE